MTAIRHFVDVLEIAVRIERQGMEMYRRFYEEAEAPQAKSVFSLLAAEEERHAGTFRTMLEKKADYTPRYDYPGEYGLFLNEMASSILKPAETRGPGAADLNDALKRGVELEKDTILFYLEIKQEGHLEPDEAQIIQQLIDEERSHWKKLLALKGNLNF